VKMKKYCTLLLSVLLVISSVAGCGTLPGMEETVPKQETEEGPRVLTHVYTGTKIEKPKNVLHNNFEFLYCTEDRIVFWATLLDSQQIRSVFVSYPMNDEEPTVTDIDVKSPSIIFAFEDGFVCTNSVTNPANQEMYTSLHLQLDDGTVQSLERIPGISDYVSALHRDSEGYIYLADSARILVLTPELTTAFTVQADNYVDAFHTSSEGTVYYTYSRQGSTPGTLQSYLVPLDKANQCAGETMTLPDSIQAHGFSFGPSYDLYYYNSVGVYGWNSGDSDGTLLLDFDNSNVVFNTIFGSPVYVVGENRFLIKTMDITTGEPVYRIYTPGVDVVLSETVMIELAMTELNQNLRMLVNQFNQEHTDTQIVTEYYHKYNTAENPTGGSTKLANDILNGLYVPDIIYGPYSDGGIRAIIDNDMFLNLETFLEADDTLKRADIFGCVLNSFRKDDKLYGLPLSFEVSGVIGNRELLGERDGWTLDEMLDYIRSLPEGVEYMEGLYQSGAPAALLGPNGYTAFIDFDTDTCSFTGETFTGFLEYLKTLPREEAISEIYDIAGPYRTGKVTARSYDYNNFTDFLRENLLFGENNAVYIGYPAENGSSGFTLEYNDKPVPAFTILSSAEAPENCWSFIRDILLEDNLSKANGYENGPFPALKKGLETAKEYIMGRYVKFSTKSATASHGSNSSINAPNSYDMTFQMTEEDWQRMLTFLDTVGSPLTSAVLPADVSAIIEEEISAYLGSTKSAEACADMIQSRVSIYLAEHS